MPAGEVKVGIFALRDIPVGEELSYDYQFQHYGLAQAAGDYRSGLSKMHAHDTCALGRRTGKICACCSMSEQLLLDQVSKNCVHTLFTLPIPSSVFVLLSQFTPQQKAERRMCLVSSSAMLER